MKIGNALAYMAYRLSGACKIEKEDVYLLCPIEDTHN